LDIPVLITMIIYMHLYPFKYLRKVKQFIKTNCVDKNKVLAHNLFWYKGNSFCKGVLINSYCAAFHVGKKIRITESQNSRGWKGPLWVI